MRLSEIYTKTLSYWRRQNERAQFNRHHERQGTHGKSAKEVGRDARGNVEGGKGGRMSSQEDSIIDAEIRDEWWEQGEAVMKEMCDEDDEE